MSVNVNKVKSEPYKATTIVGEINASSDIVPSCLSITAVGDDLTLEFAAALSGAEDTALDALLAAHVPPVESIEVTTLPFSDIDKNKLAVHPSYKPQIEGITTYAVWSGSGDEVDLNGDLVDNGEIGGGPLIHLDCQTDVNETHIEIKYHPNNGRIWLHEAYIKFAGAPEKAFVTGGIVAMATPLQQSVNLDLVVEGNWIKFAPGGPGTGTDGFADANKIVLVPRTFSHDGDWNYDGVSLTPNMDGTGEYKITAVEQIVHQFVNRIPCFGDCPYFSITSDETTELPKHYFIRVCAKTTDGNNFASAWHASVILEIYRERTYSP